MSPADQAGRRAHRPAATATVVWPNMIRDLPRDLDVTSARRLMRASVGLATSRPKQSFRTGTKMGPSPLAGADKKIHGQTIGICTAGHGLLAMRLHVAMLGLLIASVATSAHARNQQDIPPPPIVEASPALAPFQHVQFCRRYPSDCTSNPSDSDRIDSNTKNIDLLKRVNHDVNATISPTVKSHSAGWAIAPSTGDCNDYAVTKRHELLQSGLPAKALRLSVVKTSSGIGHLVLIAATTKGDLVLDNLTETIRPWQRTDYYWLKIQSARDARFWSKIRTSGPPV